MQPANPWAAALHAMWSMNISAARFLSNALQPPVTISSCECPLDACSGCPLHAANQKDLGHCNLLSSSKTQMIPRELLCDLTLHPRISPAALQPLAGAVAATQWPGLPLLPAVPLHALVSALPLPLQSWQPPPGPLPTQHRGNCCCISLSRIHEAIVHEASSASLAATLRSSFYQS